MEPSKTADALETPKTIDSAESPKATKEAELSKTTNEAGPAKPQARLAKSKSKKGKEPAWVNKPSKKDNLQKSDQPSLGHEKNEKLVDQTQDQGTQTAQMSGEERRKQKSKERLKMLVERSKAKKAAEREAKHSEKRKSSVAVETAPASTTPSYALIETALSNPPKPIAPKTTSKPIPKTKKAPAKQPTTPNNAVSNERSPSKQDNPRSKRKYNKKKSRGGKQNQNQTAPAT